MVLRSCLKVEVLTIWNMNLRRGWLNVYTLVIYPPSHSFLWFNVQLCNNVNETSVIEDEKLWISKLIPWNLSYYIHLIAAAAERFTSEVTHRIEWQGCIFEGSISLDFPRHIPTKASCYLDCKNTQVLVTRQQQKLHTSSYNEHCVICVPYVCRNI
jgi:hypothetical protein